MDQVTPPRRTIRRAFTLIEVLVAIALITLLLGMLMPALGAAREKGRIARCLSNLRQITIFNGMYMRQDETESPTWHMGSSAGGVPFSSFSEFVYGGFRAPQPSDPNADYARLETAARPLNAAIVKPCERGSEPVGLYVCPSDQSAADSAGATSAWETYGNSYPINWAWVNYFIISGGASSNVYDVAGMSQLGRKMLRRKVGGPSSRFVMFMENPMDEAVASARPDGSSPAPRVYGWHRQFSRFSMAFLDGGAAYLSVDTRYAADPETGMWSAWPEPGT